MLKIIIPTMMLIPTPLLIKKNTLFTYMTLCTMLNALLATQLLYSPMQTDVTFLNQHLFIDKTSAPLIALSYWLSPMMIMASQNHLKKETNHRKRGFMLNVMLLQTILAMTMASTNTLLFYTMFEATIIPTMIIITRWGNQPKRLTAGTYLIYYTLVGSMPLLIAIMFMMNQGYSNFLMTFVEKTSQSKNLENSMLWISCMLAFLTKMPLYGLHLWLPKAHVEAPIAGSMVLAAILLKLGGYGIIRFQPSIPQTTWLMYPVISVALWGTVMAGMTCMRKTDLKALIAYSSISHMGLVTAAVLIQTPNSTTAAIIMMVAHGLTSSMLFCLANILYERTNTRIMMATRGIHGLTPSMTNYWLFACLTNMALPPTINFMAEIKIMTTLFNWSPITIILTATGTVISAIYSLQMFTNTQQGRPSEDYKVVYPVQTREILTLTMHAIPTILLTISPVLF